MAKKSTWEKRKSKVQKEEFLVLGGKTKITHKINDDKPAFKKDSDDSTRRPRTRTSSDFQSKPKPAGSRSYGRKDARTEEEGGSRKPRTRSTEASESTRRFAPKGDFNKPRSADGASSSGRKSFGRDDDRRGGKPTFDRGKGVGEKKFNPSDFITRDGDEGGNSRFKGRGNADKQFRQSDRKKSYGKFTKDNPFKRDVEKPTRQLTDEVRLNKYLSMAGICSRREADKFIEDGLVTVNGQVVTALGTKVKPSDVVAYAGEKVRAEAMRYILLNKPKDCITTLSDEKGRSTVIGLVKNACKERVYPVGRLDRNTTGLILLTNDGEMADKLAHPSNDIRKVYHVITDKNVSIADLKKLETGVQLEDGVAKADAALFAGDGSVRNEIGLEIHSGRNRIVRRMFAALGYEVVRLDRAAFAGLSKKGLPRGRWRFLTEKEIAFLKML
jgi:23S rRNA pseudouridine2605 synthase